MDTDYYRKLLNKLAIALVIIGALNWGYIGVARVNLLEKLFGRGAFVRLLYVIVGIAALSIAFYRDTYLPFLGETVLPCSVLQNQTPPGATRTVQVQVEPGAKIIYWASEPADATELVNYQKAYREYQNAGVATADELGIATLKVREPQSYTVPIKGQLKSHIHYRVCEKSGFIGPVKTLFL
jgi:uncharacterized membrane protein YuzA (DUF378 family)